MTLADLSDTSQAVAAVAVVASLIILILQNHQANLLARQEAMRRHIEGLQNIARELFETPGLADVWQRGTSDFEKLSDEDRVKFLAFATYTTRVWEGLHQQYLRGQVEAELWRAHAQQLRDVQVLSGMKRAWALRKHVFSETFQKFYAANETAGVAMDIYGLRASKEGKPVEGNART